LKKRFLLQLSNPEGDCNFLNATPIQFEFLVKFGTNDSGWCDGSTGARIISNHDKIILFTQDDEEEAVIKFTFGDRLREIKDDEVSLVEDIVNAVVR
jgi:hypothetical protein